MYFLGVDGGQSKTRAVIGDRRCQVLGAGEAGPCNVAEAEDAGHEKFGAAILHAVRAAAAAAGLSEIPEFAGACLGLSGGAAGRRERIASLIRARHLAVTDDAEIALWGATAGRPGIIVIAGTGSIARGKNAAGRTARAGGWGPVFGDEGGAFDIVRQALRAMLRHEEGWGPPTAVRQLLLQEAGAASANELMHRFYSSEFPKDRVAGFAPLVDQAAAAGDAVTARILEQAAQTLALLAANVRSQLFQPGETVAVAMSGGVFGSLRISQRFRMLLEMESGCQAGPAKMDAAAGALLAACQSAGIASGPERR